MVAEKKHETETPKMNDAPKAPVRGWMPEPAKPAQPDLPKTDGKAIPEPAADGPTKTVLAEIAQLLMDDQSARAKPPTLLYTAQGALAMAERIVKLLKRK